MDGISAHLKYLWHLDDCEVFAFGAGVLAVAELIHQFFHVIKGMLFRGGLFHRLYLFEREPQTFTIKNNIGDS